MNGEILIRRSVLFFPASRPDRYAKAVASGADVVCIDLEDGVAPADKESARACAMRLLQEREINGTETLLRINDVQSAVGLEDVPAVVQLERQPDALVIPKVDSAEQVHWIEQMLERHGLHTPLIPMVETATGLAHAEEIATSTDRVTALLFGGVDLSADLGAAIEWDALLYARGRIVHAAALARIDALDMPFLHVSSADGLRVEAAAVSRMGFRGKIAIHPTQVPVIHEAFSPSEAEVAKARRVIQAFEESQERVVLLDGALVERPVIKAAMRTVAIAERIAGNDTAPHR